MPEDIPMLNKTDVDNSNSVVMTWTAPVNGMFLGYNYSTDSETSFTFTTANTQTLSGLDWCTKWTFDIYSVGDCGSSNSDVLSENPQSLSHYLGTFESGWYLFIFNFFSICVIYELK